MAMKTKASATRGGDNVQANVWNLVVNFHFRFPPEAGKFEGTSSSRGHSSRAQCPIGRSTALVSARSAALLLNIIGSFCTRTPIPMEVMFCTSPIGVRNK